MFLLPKHERGWKSQVSNRWNGHENSPSFYLGLHILIVWAVGLVISRLLVYLPLPLVALPSQTLSSRKVPALSSHVPPLPALCSHPLCFWNPCHQLCVNEPSVEGEWKWGHEFRTWFISNQATTELEEGWLVSLISISKVELQVRHLSDYFHLWSATRPFLYSPQKQPLSIVIPEREMTYRYQPIFTQQEAFLI